MRNKAEKKTKICHLCYVTEFDLQSTVHLNSEIATLDQGIIFSISMSLVTELSEKDGFYRMF